MMDSQRRPCVADQMFALFRVKLLHHVSIYGLTGRRAVEVLRASNKGVLS
jgi:hypothetical protein